MAEIKNFKRNLQKRISYLKKKKVLTILLSCMFLIMVVAFTQLTEVRGVETKQVKREERPYYGGIDY